MLFFNAHQAQQNGINLISNGAGNLGLFPRQRYDCAFVSESASNESVVSRKSVWDPNCLIVVQVQQEKKVFRCFAHRFSV